MRLDHIAYRVKDRRQTAKFFQDTLGYTTATEFKIEFEDQSIAECVVLTPPEKRPSETESWALTTYPHFPYMRNPIPGIKPLTYHAPSEIFISDGPPESIVGDWVAERAGVGGIHHIAYQCEDVAATMKEWREKGYAEFLSEDPLTCPGLTQVFTKPSELTGVIYELISRTDKGFCEDNVKNLMTSTKGL